MKKEKYYLYLSREERGAVLEALVETKNEVLCQGHYTDGIDDLLCKLAEAGIRRMRVRTV